MMMRESVCGNKVKLELAFHCNEHFCVKQKGADMRVFIASFASLFYGQGRHWQSKAVPKIKKRNKRGNYTRNKTRELVQILSKTVKC